MILETLLGSFFSGLGSTIFQELMNLKRKKREEELRTVIRDELEKFMRMPSSPTITIDDALVDEVIRRLVKGAISDPKLVSQAAISSPQKTAHPLKSLDTLLFYDPLAR